MPRLPQIVQDQPLQGSGLSIGSAMAPGDAAARLGQDAANIGTEMTQRIIDVQRSEQVMQKTSQGAEAAAKLYDQITNDPSIPNDQIAQHVQDGFKVLHDNIGSDIKDRKVREMYDQNFTALTEQHVVHAIGLQRDRIISSANASRADANDKLTNLAIDQTGPQLDAIIGQLHGNVASAVANRQITAEQGQKELDSALKTIDTGKTLQLIRNDPAQAFSDLQDQKKYTELDPVERQRLTNYAQYQVLAKAQQTLTDLREARIEQDKLRKSDISSDDTQLTLKATEGKLTHQDLAAIIQKYNQPGMEPFPSSRVEVLTDMINKPPQNPSDPKVLQNTELAVTAVHPTVTQSALADLYHQGTINLPDYIRLNDKLTANLHYLDDHKLSAMRERQSQAEMVIRAYFGGDPQIMGHALKDMSEGSAAQGGQTDPAKLLQPIIDRYKPQMDVLGGASRAAVIGRFNSAMTAYTTSVEAQKKWSSGVRGAIADTFETNPYDDFVLQRKEDLLNKAKAAGRILRPTTEKDGRTWIQPDGVRVMSLGGNVIPQ